MDRFLVKRASPGKNKQEPLERKGGDLDCARDGEEKKRPRLEIPGTDESLVHSPWKQIRAEGLNCDYKILFGKTEADKIFQELEEEVEYFEGKQTKWDLMSLAFCLMTSVQS